MCQACPGQVSNEPDDTRGNVEPAGTDQEENFADLDWARYHWQQPHRLQHWASNFPLTLRPPHFFTGHRHTHFQISQRWSKLQPRDLKNLYRVTPLPMGAVIVHLGCRNNTHTSDFKELKLCPSVLDTVSTREDAAGLGFIWGLAHIPLPPTPPPLVVFSLCLYTDLCGLFISCLLAFEDSVIYAPRWPWLSAYPSWVTGLLACAACLASIVSPLPLV